MGNTYVSIQVLTDIKPFNLKTGDEQYRYCISANSFRGNYSFLNLALFIVTFDLYFIDLNSCRGNYSREETIQGRKLFAEIRYAPFLLACHYISIVKILN